MRILESSDWHLEPNEPLPRYASWFFELANMNQSVAVVLNGDTFNTVIHRVKDYRPSRVFSEFIWAMPPQGIWIVTGNHDRRQDLKKLFEGLGSLNVKIVKSFDFIGDDDICWHFEHGDRFAIDWGGPMGWIYNHIAAAGTRFFPKLWYNFCKWRGWVPSVYKPLEVKGGESQKYTELTGYIWGHALEYAEKNLCNVVVGHTHTAKMIGNGRCVVDGGDIRDGSYVVIEDDKAEIRWFK